MLIDTHCHLTDLSNSEILETIARAKAKGVEKYLCVGASRGKESNLRAREILELDDSIFISIGIHPHDVDNTIWDDDLLMLAEHPRTLAIGETGLDYFKNWSDFSKQKEVFIESISIAKKLNKPLIIHCRDALEDTLRTLKENQADLVGGVFHCYSGTKETAAELAKINFRVSYTGIITFKNSHGVKDGAKEIPLEQILLETDSPYMAPEPHRGKQSEPAHVFEIAHCLAKLKGITVEEIAKTTSENAKRLFNFT